MAYAREKPSLPININILQLAADSFISGLVLSLVCIYDTAALNTLRQKARKCTKKTSSPRRSCRDSIEFSVSSILV